MANKPWVTGGEIRVFLLISLVLSLVVGGITALVTILNVPPEPRNKLPTLSPFKQTVEDTIPKTLLLSDFQYPGPPGALGSRTWAFSRPFKKQWTDEEIKKYWVEPEKTESSTLKDRNDAGILQFLQDVP